MICHVLFDDDDDQSVSPASVTTHIENTAVILEYWESDSAMNLVWNLAEWNARASHTDTAVSLGFLKLMVHGEEIAVTLRYRKPLSVLDLILGYQKLVSVMADMVVALECEMTASVTNHV